VLLLVFFLYSANRYCNLVNASLESEAARLQREREELEEFERQRRQKDEERKRLQEEAWRKEQQTLEELSNKQKKVSPQVC